MTERTSMEGVGTSAETLEEATANVAERIRAIVRGDLHAGGGVVQALRERVAEGRALIRAHHERGASGRQVVHATSRLADAVVGSLYDHFRERYRAAAGADGAVCALVALGGYGRDELSPCSDVDILFLWEGEASDVADYLAQQMVSPLWDLGFQVGHSARSIAQSLSLVESDTAAFTAMLSSRLLRGSEELYARFRDALLARVAAGGGRHFITAKIAERSRRYRNHGDSVSLLEPNVKESPGGLRDAQLVELVTLVGGSNHTTERWRADGLIAADEQRRVDVAVEFFHRVRNELHFRQGRKNDLLSAQIQGDVAQALGYRGDGKLQPVEAFMREYYTHAATVHRFSELLLDLHQRAMLEDGGQEMEREPLEDGMFRRGDEVELAEDPSRLLAEDPLLFLRVFVAGQRENLRLGRAAEQALRSNLSLISEELRGSRAARKLFFEILSHERAAPSLRKMQEIGILGQYLPEFGELTHLVRYDIYHHYSVDEHVLRAIEACEELAWTPARELHGLAAIYRRLPAKWFPKFVLLCHDLGKSEKHDHVASSVRKTRGILQRWRMDNRLSSQIELLITNHLTMSQLAQRRDMHDEKLVESFAKAVGDVETLELLYLITYADIRAVSPQSWTAWRGALLWELYRRALRCLGRDQKYKLSSEEFQRTVREEVKLELAGQVGEGAVDEYLHSMPYKYIVSTPVERIAKHMKMVSALGDEVVILDYEHNFDVGYTELVVCTLGRPGIFSKIAGVLASRNINIIGADVYTTAGGLAVDTLRVEGVDKNPVVDDEKWKRVEEDLAQVISGAVEVDALVARGARFSPRRAALPFTPQVSVDNNISDTHTVIEVVAPDFLGLLFHLTEMLFACGVDIYVARISTEADRAVDVFYVTDFGGNKITSQAKIEEIGERLAQFLAG